VSTACNTQIAFVVVTTAASLLAGSLLVFRLPYCGDCGMSAHSIMSSLMHNDAQHCRLMPYSSRADVRSVHKPEYYQCHCHGLEYAIFSSADSVIMGHASRP
jgi:hypothetical protein